MIVLLLGYNDSTQVIFYYVPVNSKIRNNSHHL